jgi:hypothetical protein
MHRRLAYLVLVVLVLVPLVSFASSSAPFRPSRLETCTVWIGTDYFTDAAKTNRVGVCTLNCFQATHGVVTPTFEDGGTCTGAPGPYTLRRYYGCPGICP